MREIGATTAAPWHHDEPYFDFTGRLCVVWLPLEAAPKSEGLPLSGARTVGISCLLHLNSARMYRCLFR
ncbi:MAG: hypothetical protein CM1200mP41_37360 [Gammaproteobacteria bacterium]|nr:MAG: hypothetical protein CM1200mP41_37360 [Gammaproteobacteria bacterium]